MYKNKIEHSLMTTLLHFFQTSPDRQLIFRWNDCTHLRIKLDTFYETDNGLELNEEGYEEYHACAILIREIYTLPEVFENSIEWPSRAELKPGVFTEISYHNAPEKILTVDGNLVWEKGKIG